MTDKEETIGSKIKLSLQRIGAYFISSFTDFRRSPLTVFFSIAYPIILILLFGAIFSNENTSSITFDLYYQSGGDSGYEFTPGVTTNITDDLLTILEDIQRNDSEPLFNLHAIPHLDDNNNPVNPGTYLDEVEGYIALVLPENLTQQAFFNPPINIDLIMVENSQLANIAENIITGIVYDFNLFVAGYNDTNIGLETYDIYLEEGIEYFEFLIPGMIGVAIMNNAVIGTISRFAQFRKKGLFRKMASSPMKRFELVTGESTWIFVQGVISIIAVLLIGWLVFKLPAGDFNWFIQVLDWKMLPITIAAVLSFSGIGMIGASIVKNPNAATATGNFLTFPMMFLSGAFFEVNNIPGLNVASKMLPLTYIINAYRASMITMNNSIAWINIGISLAFGVVLFTIGVLITKLSERG